MVVAFQFALVAAGIAAVVVVVALNQLKLMLVSFWLAPQRPKTKRQTNGCSKLRIPLPFLHNDLSNFVLNFLYVERNFRSIFRTKFILNLIKFRYRIKSNGNRCFSKIKSNFQFSGIINHIQAFTDCFNINEIIRDCVWPRWLTSNWTCYVLFRFSTRLNSVLIRIYYLSDNSICIYKCESLQKPMYVQEKLKERQSCAFMGFPNASFSWTLITI